MHHLGSHAWDAADKENDSLYTEDDPFARVIPLTAATDPAASGRVVDADGEAIGNGDDFDAGKDDREYVAVPSRARPDAAQAEQVSRAAAWGSGTLLPDPSMVWGAEGGVRNYVAASALYHANEELRRKLADASETLQTQLRELTESRDANRQAQARVDDMRQQVQQAVRERDLSLQKLTTAQQTISSLERTLRERVSDEEKVRFSLESQITELRGRLVIGADSNALLSRDVQTLLAETKDRTSEAMALRSKLALSESALSSQRHTNENLLVELRALNNQLMDERKRVILAARELQSARLVKDRVGDLEEQINLLRNEKQRVESEHVQLMADFVRVTDEALTHARREVRADIDDWRSAAQHWEEVSQLLYKDISERTRAHQRCRDECEDAKAQRDTTAAELRRAREELAQCTAKLEVIWPTHLTDTKDLSPDEILNVFGRRRRRHLAGLVKPRGRARKADRHRDGSSSSSSSNGGGGGVESLVDSSTASATLSESDDGDSLLNFRYSNGSLAEQVRELREANASLRAELVRQRLTNDLQQERIDSITRAQSTSRQEVDEAKRSLEAREAAGQKLMEKQLDRIEFLEAQVHSLRGYPVAVGAAVEDLPPDENVLELFLGQLVAAEAPSNGGAVPDAFAQVFCTVDFLLHETVTTPTITGLNGFFDTSVAFCISMDTMLLYYLQTRDLTVQLHRLRARDERDMTDGHGAEPEYVTVAEGRLNFTDIVAAERNRTAARPTLKGHVRLLDRNGRCVASLEYALTARVPYTAAFQRLIEHTFPSGGSTVGADGDAQRYQHSALRQWIESSSSAGSSRSREASARRRLPSEGSIVDETASSMYHVSPPRADTAAVDGVRTLVLQVLSLTLPPGTQPPRLACYYTIPALGVSVKLPGPMQPQDTVVYTPTEAESTFSVTSDTLPTVARDPVTLFLIDEDAVAAGLNSVWAMAVCEWAPALQEVDTPKVLDLAVVRQQRILSGASVRLTLMASTRTPPADSVVPAPPAPLPPPPPPPPVLSAAEMYPQAPRPTSGVPPSLIVDTREPRWEDSLLRPRSEMDQQRDRIALPTFGGGDDMDAEMLQLELNRLDRGNHTF